MWHCSHSRFSVVVTDELVPSLFFCSHHLTMMTWAGWSMSEVSSAMCMSLVISSIVMYSISQEICTRFLLCCALLWLYTDWFSHIHQAPVAAKQPWWIWINTSCEFITNDCITTTKQSTTKPCAYCLGYTVLCNFACYIDAWEYWVASFTTKWCTRFHVSKRINTDLWFVWYCFYHFLQLLLSAIISKDKLYWKHVLETDVGEIHSCNMNSPIWWTLKWYIHLQEDNLYIRTLIRCQDVASYCCTHPPRTLKHFVNKRFH